MREIKYRVWLKNKKEMADVDIIDIRKKKINVPLVMGHWLFPSAEIYYFGDVDLMQYTGLHDKNGKDIYEGDIVKCYDIHSKANFIAVVEFGNPNAEYTWGWQLKRINGCGDAGLNFDILLWVEMEESGAFCEIIGNIYENPELVEEVCQENQE